MLLTNAKKIYDDLKSKKMEPVYFIFGDEPYLKSELLRSFREQIVNPETQDFNFCQYEAEKVDASRIIEETQVFPMMSDFRLVFVMNCEVWTDRNWEDLEPALSSTGSSTVLVLSAGKVDRRRKFFKKLAEQVCSVELKKPFENQIPTWIQYIAKGLGIRLEAEAVHLMHRLVGNSLIEIESELKKVRDYLGERKQVGIQDIQQVVSRQREESIFDFTQAIGERKWLGALENLNHLLDQGQNEVGVINMAARHLRILMTLKKGEDLGLHGVKLAHYAQVPAFFLEGYLGQSRNWSQVDLEVGIVELCRMDCKLKTSSRSTRVELERLVWQLCPGARI